MRKTTFLTISILFTIAQLSLTPFALGQSCEKQTAPAAFPYRADPSSKKGFPTNIGIVAKGFVDIDDTTVVHGIDVSKYQDQTDFTNLRQCERSTSHPPDLRETGMHSPFVYVRLTGGDNPDNETLYRTHWYNARSLNLLVGPYHAFVVQDSSSPISSINSAHLERLKQTNLESAGRQAKLFTQTLGELLSADPLLDVAKGNYGKPYLPIALVLMERPQDRFSDDDRHLVGKLYGEAACKWIGDVKSNPSFKDQKIIIFTSASIFSDYGLSEAPCDLRAGGVWISQHTLDGSRYGDVSDIRDRRRVEALCNSADSHVSRCIFQQYTSYGGFALFKADTPLDLDRFYGSETELRSLVQQAKHPEIWK